jgi:glutaredoxin-like protein
VENAITIFGTWWCGDCVRARRYFDRNQILYAWVDIDKDEVGEEFVLSTNHGMRSVPTIVFEDGSILVEPSDTELRLKFEKS